MSDKGKLEALAAMIAAEISGAPQRPKLRIVRAEDIETPSKTAGLDAPTRDFMCSRIRDLARMYWLGWLVRQETTGTPIECLDDDALRGLLRKMEAARECRVEGIGFDDAGLIRESEV